jgi:hypothetical protein
LSAARQLLVRAVATGVRHDRHVADGWAALDRSIMLGHGALKTVGE